MSNVTEISAAEFDARVRRAGQPVVVDFFSTECPPCEALAPRLEAVAAQYAGRARFFKMFRQGNRELAVELGVLGSPTLVFFGRDGQEHPARLTGGAISRQAIQAELDALLAAG